LTRTDARSSVALLSSTEDGYVDLRTAYTTLEIAPGSDAEAVRLAHSALRDTWRPDRLAESMRRKAAAKLQLIDEAYGTIEAAGFPAPSQIPGAPATGARPRTAPRAHVPAAAPPSRPGTSPTIAIILGSILVLLLAGLYVRSSMRAAEERRREEKEAPIKASLALAERMRQLELTARPLTQAELSGSTFQARFEGEKFIVTMHNASGLKMVKLIAEVGHQKVELRHDLMMGMDDAVPSFVGRPNTASLALTGAADWTLLEADGYPATN
jgi:hypothetical protein